MRKKGLLLITCLVMILVLLLGACSSPQAAPGASAPSATKAGAPPATVIKWISASPYQAGVPDYTEFKTFLEKTILEMTGGRLQITHNIGGAVVPAYSELDALNKGVLDCAITQSVDAVGVLGTVSNLFLGYPGGPPLLEMMPWYYFEGNALLQQLYDKAGVKNVVAVNPTYFNAPEIGFMANKSLANLADWKGLKLRTFGMSGNVMQKMGNTVVTVPGSEMLDAVKRGVVDAIEYADAATNIAYGIPEVLKVWHLPGLQCMGAILHLTVNKQKWDALPPDIQRILKEATRAEAMGMHFRRVNSAVEAMTKLPSLGIKVVNYSPEFISAFNVAAEAVAKEESAKDPFFAQVYNSQAKFFKAWEASGQYKVR